MILNQITQVMPHIEEKDLLRLHKKIETSSQQLEHFEKNFYDTRQKAQVLKQQRRLYLRISLFTLLLLLGGIATYFAQPSLFINENLLAEQGYDLAEITEIEALESRIAYFEAEKANLMAANTYDNSEVDSIIYAVQVGAFEEQMISMRSETVQNIKEYQIGPYYKYALGHFEGLEEAQRFRKELLKMGFKDAFVASYQNGSRIRIENPW